MAISTTKQGSLGRDSTQINQYETQSQINAAPTTKSAPSNGRLPQLRNGDNSITVDTNGLIVRQGAAGGSYFATTISNAVSKYLAYQSGTVAPTTANYPVDGNYGFYENTATTQVYWATNHSGNLVVPSLSTMAGQITADQHGALAATNSAGSNLHPLATTASPGFLSAADYTLLAGATAVTSNNTLFKRSAAGGGQLAVLNLVTSGGAAGALQVAGTNVDVTDINTATASATANELVRRNGTGGANFGGTLLGATINATAQYNLAGTAIINSKQPVTAAAVTQTATGSYGTNEQNMLNDLKALANDMRAQMVAVGGLFGP